VLTKRAAALAPLLPLFPAPAPAQRPAAEIYAEAIQTAQQGDPQRAVEMLQGIVQDTDPLTDDALFQIGHRLEKEVGDYDGAEAAYTQLLERFPRSKSALRAGQRLAALR